MNTAIANAPKKEQKPRPTESIEQLVAAEVLTNSLSSLCEQLNLNGVLGSLGPEISQADGLFNNNRWYLISNLRQLLSQIYVEHGIVQTLVDQPVEDAYRAGFEIKTGQLDADELERLMIYCKRHKVIHAIMQARKWARLYGGGGVLIVTNQNPQTPFRIASINENTPLEFRAVDMWELFYDVQNTSGTLEVGHALGENLSQYYSYYGLNVDRSRVFRIVGKEAPAFIRPRLRGWGMSELEKLVRSLNQYLKNQDVIFELLNEAKIDVYGVNGYNNSLALDGGTGLIAQRMQLANQIKNYQNAIVMDAKDTYAQKQITFTGLSEVLLQIRQGIAADLKMPMTKIFGISAAGFNSGEDDIENYNSMVESEIRQKDEWVVVDVLAVVCQKLFGFVPDDLQISWSPLRVLNAKEEEEVKDSQFNRVVNAFSTGLMQDTEAKEAFNKDSLVSVEIDENVPALPPLATEAPEPKGATGKSGSGAPDKGKAK